MYKAVIFDVDGTLIDTEQSILQSLQHVLKEEGLSYEQEDLRFALGIPGKETLARLGIEDSERVQADWSDAVLAYADDVTLFAGAQEVIEQLAESPLRLGIVTSKTRREVTDEFDPFGLSHHFDAIVSASDTQLHKPCPDPLLLCLDKLGVTHDEAIYIGDSIYDMQCAQSARVQFALALWGAQDAGQFETADFILRQPEDVLSLL
ncbi:MULTISPECIES: HAD family hydrolase [Sporosarcina]|uniref:HAD family hydrolase n=1 Tax=Sporosarcina TaxID=1569 RepID=UPI00058E45FA|nr:MULTISPECIES: HAD family hydrolase [Sporosarcina]WJY28304.1 HAD family hydrolase [Sporosarcina sp. 0.2-SM1T-5]